MKILVLDVGGTHVKMYFSGVTEARKFDSGAEMTPATMIAKVKELAKDWAYDAVTIGFPSPIIRGKILREPHNLGIGWTRFNFEKALKKPVKIINDAAIQAIGSYEGKRMLFLGLGTGLGSTLIADGVVIPLELCDLRFSKSKNIEQVVGKNGLKKSGRAAWEKQVYQAVEFLTKAFIVDYVVIGGGNSKNLKTLPAGIRLGSNSLAWKGGERLWEKTTEFAHLQKDRLVII